MKRSAQFLFKFLLLLYFIANNTYCNSKNSNEERKISNRDSLNNPKDQSTDSLAVNLYKQISELLEFEDLNFKNVGTEIRFWHIPTFSDTGRVIRIMFENEKWISSANEFKIIFNANHDITSIINKKYENNLFNNWDFFIERMESYGIFNLRNHSEIPDYYLTFGGDYIYLEILKNGKYKKCLFLSYKDNEAKIKDVQQLLLIIFLIQREIGYNLLSDPFLPWQRTP